MARTNPNQKVITIHKDPKGEKDYTYFTWKSLDEARANLKPGAFMLWTYLAQNKEGFELALSSSDYCGGSTMGKTAYDNAVAELIEKGYLVLKSGKTVYDFIEKPVRSEEPPLSQNQTTKISLSENQTTKSNKTLQRKVIKHYNEK